MKIILTARLWASLLMLAVFAVSTFAGEVVPVLHTPSGTYSNLTVISRTTTHVFIRHARGVANIKVAELDAEALRSISPDNSGNAVVTPATAATVNDPAQSKEGALASKRSAAASGFLEMLVGMLADIKEAVPASMVASFGLVIGVTLAVLLCLYLFYSYCVRLICLKSGYQPGILAWLPIVRDYALFRASGMSVVWFLVLMSPGVIVRVIQGRFQGWEYVVLGACLVAVMVHCYWCVRICQARGKGTPTMLFLIIPFTYPFAFLYLAFSGGGVAADSEGGPAVKSV